MIFYWTAILAISTLLYVLLDCLDLGVGIISGGVGSHARRDAMMNAIAPIWDGNVHGAAIGGGSVMSEPGNDIEDFLKNPPAPRDSAQARLMTALLEFDKPLIAAGLVGKANPARVHRLRGDQPLRFEAS
jgi:hypothetical protein